MSEPQYTMADVYRHAAEVIVRDGKFQGSLVGEPWGDRAIPASETPENLADRSRPVCAIGACFRAEYELNGNKFPKEVLDGAYDVCGIFDWDRFIFHTDKGLKIWAYNDLTGVTAEDIALELKQHAEDISP